MDGLVAWLRDVFDDLERVARAAVDLEESLGPGEPGTWASPCNHGAGPYPASHDLCARIDASDMTIYDEGGHTAEQAIHITRHDPRAILARVEAERAIAERLVDQLEWLPQPGSGDVGALSEAEAACYRDLLRWLAYGHRYDIPGWREEWVPERVR